MFLRSFINYINYRMRGKVKFIYRTVYRIDYHQKRYKICSFIKLYNGKNVMIDDNQIKKIFRIKHITNSCINTLNKKLCNKKIEYLNNKNRNSLQYNFIYKYL